MKRMLIIGNSGTGNLVGLNSEAYSDIRVITLTR